MNIIIIYQYQLHAFVRSVPEGVHLEHFKVAQSGALEHWYSFFVNLNLILIFVSWKVFKIQPSIVVYTEF